MGCTMAKNIGFSQRAAKSMAHWINSGQSQVFDEDIEAYAQKEEHWYLRPKKGATYQWVVVLQKKWVWKNA